MNRKSIILVISALLFTLESYTQQLFQFGHADAFVSGLYKGIFPLQELNTYGDFGLGAPDMVDGELTILDGMAYQSTADGKTIQAPASSKTPFVIVTNFKADTLARLSSFSSLTDLYTQLSTYLPNKHAIYAIKLRGSFDRIKTRAFPKVNAANIVPLAQMLDKQKFFEQDKVDGTLIGFWIPSYLAGINIAGFHFHFLSNNMALGGHVLEIMSSQNTQVEIAKLEDFLLRIPDEANYRRYPFTGENNSDLKKVEKGGN